MAFDPFDDVADEAQTQNQADPGWQPGPDDAQPVGPWDDTPVNNSKENNKVTVVNNSEGKVVVTLKGGAGYDAPWIVVHAADVHEANEILRDGDAVKELVDRTKAWSKVFAGSPAAGQARQQGGSSRPAHQEAPGGQKKYCDHGEMKFLSGISKKTGQPYKMFVCQEQDRSRQCKPKNVDD
jgi:hypothetical protein